MTQLGIDVSENNGEIDWKRIAEEGIGFAIIRTGYGSAYLDSRFYENVNGAHDAGLKLGGVPLRLCPSWGRAGGGKKFPPLHPQGLRSHAQTSSSRCLLGCGRRFLSGEGVSKAGGD